MKPTSFPNCDNPTIEFATDPPEIVSSIVNFDNSFLNSFSSISFIVLLVKEFSFKKLSSTLHNTSTIALPIPKTFILGFFCNYGFLSVRITSGTNFTS